MLIALIPDIASELRLAPFIIRYGQPQHSLPRKVIELGLMRQTSLELHPPRLYAHVLLPPDLGGTAATEFPPQVVTVSVTDTIADVNKALIQAIYPPERAEGKKFRVWKFENAPTDIPYFTVDHIRRLPVSLQNDGPETVHDAFLDVSDRFAVEATMNNLWIVPEDDVQQVASSVRKPTLSAISDFPIGAHKKIFNSGSDFFSKLQASAMPDSDRLSKAGISPLPSIEMISQANSSPISSVDTFSRSGIYPHNSGSLALPKDSRPVPSSRSTIIPGTLGLGNM